MGTANGTRPGKAILRKKLKSSSVGEISEILDVDPAHIYNVERRGVSPTLHEALVDAGWVDPPPKVYVVAFHMRDPDTAAALRRTLDALGSRREVGKAIVEGRIRLVEVDE